MPIPERSLPRRLRLRPPRVSARSLPWTAGCALAVVLAGALVLDFAGNTGMFLYSIALFLVDRERPPLRLVHVESASYPSGHVSATVAAMVATAIVVGRLWIWISGTVLSVAMMYSRMYLGAHWLSDTVAGALLALGLTLLLWALAHDKCLARNIARRDQTRRTRGQREAPS
jgi:undecaprenyl-diphosphatase